MLRDNKTKDNLRKELEDILSILRDDAKQKRKINSRMLLNAIYLLYGLIDDHESRFDALRAALRDR